VSPVKYELGFYIPEDDILHSHCRENLKSYSFLNHERLKCGIAGSQEPCNYKVMLSDFRN
jgi:hypothetical protein